MTFTCDKCGASFTRKFNLKRHQTSRCKSMVVMNTSAEDAACAVEESIHHPPKDSSLSRFIDNIINQTAISKVGTTMMPSHNSWECAITMMMLDKDYCINCH